VIPRVDTTAAEVLRDLVDELETEGISLVIARSSFDLRADLERFEILDDRVTLAPSIAQAVQSYRER
jgi:MFS superfamily sulfate permease-like transporter